MQFFADSITHLLKQNLKQQHFSRVDVLQRLLLINVPDAISANWLGQL